MTRRGPSKRVDAAVADVRLAKARAFMKAAQDGFADLDEDAVADPVVSSIVIAAIGYADALTARFGGQLNQKDHAAAPRLLRAVLGNKFPTEQETRLQRILSRKDEAQYGVSWHRKEKASSLLADLEKFSAWAETLLAQR